LKVQGKGQPSEMPRERPTIFLNRISRGQANSTKKKTVLDEQTTNNSQLTTKRDPFSFDVVGCKLSVVS
jgi:hypothetical protein